MGMSALSTSAFAKIPDMIDLLQSYELALASDPVFKSANDQRLGNEQAIPLAVSGFLPFVNVQATQQNQMTDNFFDYEPSPVDSILQNGFGLPPIAGTQIVRTTSYAGNVSQTLFDLSKWHTLKKSYRIKDASEAAYVDASQDLMLRTAQAYFRILDAIENLNYTTAEKDAVVKQLEQTYEKFNVGLVAITDVKELEAQRDSILAQQISAYNQIQTAREALRVIIGVLPDHLAALEENIPLVTPAPNDSDTWAGIAEETNPKLLAVKFNTEVQLQNVNIAKDENYPTINFTGNTYKARYGTWSDPTSATSQWQWTALVTAQMNIFSGGAITANIRQQQYFYQQSLEDYEKSRRDVVKAAEDAYRDVETALTSVKAYRRSVISNQVAVDATIAGYNVGTRTSVDVLTEISNLYQQQKNLATARYNYVVAILGLKKAAGVLTTQDIVAVNQLLTSKPALINKEQQEKADIAKFISEKTDSAPPKKAKAKTKKTNAKAQKPVEKKKPQN
jgi:outer membrane protein